MERLRVVCSSRDHRSEEVTSRCRAFGLHVSKVEKISRAFDISSSWLPRNPMREDRSFNITRGGVVTHEDIQMMGLRLPFIRLECIF